MKELLLLRHAKSSWDDTSLADFDRPLNERGKKAAPLMGKILREKKLKPELILCSPSKRTRQTIKLFLEAAKLEIDVTFEDGIYEASVTKLIKLLQSQKSKTQSILMVGHNPGMAGLLTELTGEIEHFPTAALAKIDLKIENWSDITRGAGELAWILRPKEL